MTPERMAELKATAQALCAPGKGFLASDESTGPWLRAGHAEAKKIPDTIENRSAYRLSMEMFLHHLAGWCTQPEGAKIHT